jgi:hypothetical protein
MDEGSHGQWMYTTNEPKNRNKFQIDFENYPQKTFFAQDFNAPLLHLGEVRMYLCYGELAQMVHISPIAQIADRKEMEPTDWQAIRAETCQNQLAGLEDIA